VAALLAALAGFPTPGALAVPATAVQCGDVITQDTTLDSDVVCSGGEQDPMTALTIAADGVTLDLNGFTILGPNRGEFVEELQAGIATDGPRSSVTIENGTIDGFDQAMVLQVSDSTMRGVTTDGAVTVTGDRNVVRDNVVSDGERNALTVDGNDNRVLRNTGSSGDSHGIVISGARNHVIGNTGESFIDAGIRVTDFADIVLRDNIGSSGVGAGIVVENGSGGVVERNVANDNSSAHGIVVLADNLLIRKNEASRNDLGGIIVLGTGNTIKQNVANDNNPESLSTYGIYAVEGNFDGGGNRARGNGAPEQCFGVTCK
jgi:parallel beta-helix repeat protein